MSYYKMIMTSLVQVIMCSLERSDDGWEVVQRGRLSEGTVRNKDPIEATIRDILDV